jgi:hypothetical protein
MMVVGKLHAPTALPSEKRPGTHCIEGWVGPRAGLDFYLFLLISIVTPTVKIFAYLEGRGLDANHSY